MNRPTIGRRLFLKWGVATAVAVPVALAVRKAEAEAPAQPVAAAPVQPDVPAPPTQIEADEAFKDARLYFLDRLSMWWRDGDVTTEVAVQSLRLLWPETADPWSLTDAEVGALLERHTRERSEAMLRDDYGTFRRHLGPRYQLLWNLPASQPAYPSRNLAWNPMAGW